MLKEAPTVLKASFLLLFSSVRRSAMLGTGGEVFQYSLKLSPDDYQF